MIELFITKLLLSIVLFLKNNTLYSYIIALFLANLFLEMNKNKKYYKSFYNDVRLKELFGTYLYYRYIKIDEKLAPKITGMLLELDNSELISLINDDKLLDKKFYEAKQVLNEYNMIEYC
jgi:hypothetical protein